MEPSEIIAAIRSSEGAKVKVAITDIDGILRGKIMHRDKFLSAAAADFGFCDVVFGWDAADAAYDNGRLTGWHTGYPDAPARIDLQSCRHIPWEGGIPFFLADFSRAEGGALPACPRSLLKSVAERCRDMGFSPVFSQEFEWFNFAESADALEAQGFREPRPMTPGMFGYSILRASMKSTYFHALFDGLEGFGVPLEGLHTETGPGVYEAAIRHAPVLEAADRAVLFKTGVKEIAYRHGVIASFMAKWRSDLPGCSGHVHQSLWDGAGEHNLFHDAQDPEGISALMRSYIAGQLHCLPEILPMYAPTVNSYKRLVEGAWAPTTLTWALDNRTTALRVLSCGEKATRLETRVVGSDVNPYLAMAACLASGLYGVAQNMTLDVPATKGNGYRDAGQGQLPADLKEATRRMQASALARELFGEEFVDHFTRTRDWEWRQYSRQVTDWELKRYFEII